MSAVRWSALEPETRASIEAQRIDLSQSARMLARTCGCSTNPDGSRVWLCQYHDGFDQGVVKGRENLLARGGGLARMGCPNCVDADAPLPEMRCMKCGTAFYRTDIPERALP